MKNASSSMEIKKMLSQDLCLVYCLRPEHVLNLSTENINC